MTIEVSCVYFDYNYKQEPIIFTFIKYDRFIKIKYGNENKSIIIKIENLKKNKLLFNFYILSILITNNISKNYEISSFYGICSYDKFSFIEFEKTWVKNRITNYDKFSFIEFEKIWVKNPFLSQEPKRETSIKKQKKFIKMINNYYDYGDITDPIYLINIFQELLLNKYTNEIKKIIEYENKIYLLSCIRGFNRDIYSNIKKFF
jgi:hypothetical protein